MDQEVGLLEIVKRKEITWKVTKRKRFRESWL